MKWFLLLLALLAGLILVVAVLGACLPRAHVASRAATFRQTPAALHALVRDVAAQPAWRSQVKAIEMLPPREGRAHFRETSRHGAIEYAVLEDVPERKFVTAIADPDLPFGGEWTFEFTPASGGGTTLRITERGEVKNVIFRFLARFVFGHTATMETYLRDLGRKVGEDVAPQP